MAAVEPDGWIVDQEPRTIGRARDIFSARKIWRQSMDYVHEHRHEILMHPVEWKYSGFS